MFPDGAQLSTLHDPRFIGIKGSYDYFPIFIVFIAFIVFPCFYSRQYNHIILSLDVMLI